MDCKIFRDYLGICNSTVKVYALLNPATEYQWVIKDKFDHEYSGVAISDGDGFLSIPVADLPDGLLTNYSGQFTLTLYYLSRKINFKMADLYDEICFDVAAGTRVKNNLGVDFDCNATSGGGGNSAVFPFDSVATLDITWNELLNSFYGSAPNVQVYLQTGPGTYELTNVSVTMNQTGYTLDSIHIDFGGAATGYALIS